MPLLDTLVVPVDFSETSRGAFRFACALARASGSHIELLHVVADPLRQPWILTAPGVDFVSMEEEWKSAARQTMERWIAETNLRPGVASVVIRSGKPAREILDYAAERRANVVVMGAHSESAVMRFFLGSVAEQVVRHSRVPVLTVPPGAGTLRKIIVPTDFSEPARDALRLARAIARDARCELHLMHVIPDPLQIPTMTGDAGIAYLHEMEEAWKAHAREQLERLVEAEGASNDDVVTAVSIGHPARMIVEYAEEQGADLVVMGAHGRSPVTEFLLGSVADRVVRQALFPVLTVPRGSLEASAPAPASEAAAQA